MTKETIFDLVEGMNERQLGIVGKVAEGVRMQKKLEDFIEKQIEECQFMLHRLEMGGGLVGLDADEAVEMGKKLRLTPAEVGYYFFGDGQPEELLDS